MFTCEQPYLIVVTRGIPQNANIDLLLEEYHALLNFFFCDSRLLSLKLIDHLPVPFSIADNLPVATRLEFYPNREAGVEEEQKKDMVRDVQFEHGYRLGFVDNNKVDII